MYFVVKNYVIGNILSDFQLKLHKVISFFAYFSF